VPQEWAAPGDVLQAQVQVSRHEVSDAARRKALEDENAKLKRLLADRMLHNVVLKDLPEKNLQH